AAYVENPTHFPALEHPRKNSGTVLEKELVGAERQTERAVRSEIVTPIADLKRVVPRAVNGIRVRSSRTQKLAPGVRGLQVDTGSWTQGYLSLQGVIVRSLDSIAMSP